MLDECVGGNDYESPSLTTDINIASFSAGVGMSPSVKPGNNAFRSSCIIQSPTSAGVLPLSI